MRLIFVGCQIHENILARKFYTRPLPKPLPHNDRNIHQHNQHIPRCTDVTELPCHVCTCSVAVKREQCWQNKLERQWDTPPVEQRPWSVPHHSMPGLQQCPDFFCTDCDGYIKKLAYEVSSSTPHWVLLVGKLANLSHADTFTVTVSASSENTKIPSTIRHHSCPSFQHFQ